MPPHCDTKDGPVVTAAKRALESGNVNLVLIWVPEEAEGEVKGAFDRVIQARKAGQAAWEVADEWFFETVVRLHRAGEGEAFTGLKPAGLDEGPVVPRAEKAIETGDPGETIRFIRQALEEDLKHRFRRVMETKGYDVNDVAAGRAYVQAFIGFVVHAHHLHAGISGHGGHGHEGHPAASRGSWKNMPKTEGTPKG
ncbi:MAG: DUF6448 family protein [Methanomicrobiales archaeon]|nr:DUF6448 family protein [Methanomicrobiales archaeon]